MTGPDSPGGVVATAAAVRAGHLSARRAADLALARLDEADPVIRAFAQRFAEPGTPDGPLAGVPVSVKDNVDVRGRVTGLGRPLHERRPAIRDAAVVARLRAAGAAIVGKTVLSEFACSAVTRNAVDGATRNPADPARTPGGSSGGSAASVAAGVVPASLGTDTAGSVLVPAALTGVYGFRPTHGTVDPAGVFPSAPSLDTVGVFARDPDGLAAVADVLLPGGPAPGRFPERPRVGVVTGWLAASAPPVRDAVADLLDRPGAVAVTLPDPGPLIEHARVLYLHEVAGSLAGLPEPSVPYSAAVEHRRRAGRALDPARIARARAARRAWRSGLDRILDGVDVLACPTAPAEAPLLADLDGSDGLDLVRFAYPFCLAGVPALSVPVGGTPLPVGLMLVAARHRDRTLLAAGRRFAAAHEPSRS